MGRSKIAARRLASAEATAGFGRFARVARPLRVVRFVALPEVALPEAALPEVALPEAALPEVLLPDDRDRRDAALDIGLAEAITAIS
jgi:hypothetical protein